VPGGIFSLALTEWKQAMDDTPDTTPLVAETMLIASDRVEGTPVFGRDGGKLGKIQTLMIDKRSGQVAYVVLSTGGFLGLGQAYHPLPWSAFQYDAQQQGYAVQIDKRMLDGGPSFRPDSTPTFDEAYGARVTDYYRLGG
jgi:sporulation protein YlmC with PRC-barrel domain